MISKITFKGLDAESTKRRDAASKDPCVNYTPSLVLDASPEMEVRLSGLSIVVPLGPYSNYFARGPETAASRGATMQRAAYKAGEYLARDIIQHLQTMGHAV